MGFHEKVSSFDPTVRRSGCLHSWRHGGKPNRLGEDAAEALSANVAYNQKGNALLALEDNTAGA